MLARMLKADNVVVNIRSHAVKCLTHFPNAEVFFFLPVCNLSCARNMENKRLYNHKHVYLLFLCVGKDPGNVMQVKSLANTHQRAADEHYLSISTISFL